MSGTIHIDDRRVVVRDAVLEDVPRLLPIYNDIILHTTAVWQYEPQSLQMRTEWFEGRQQQGFPVYVAETKEADKQPVILGFSSYGPFRNWPGYKYTVENSVYVSKDARGLGIGKKLMKSLIEKARGQQLHAMVAGIEASNDVSIGLHLSFGFVEVAHFKEVGWKFGRWMDLKFFELIL